RAQPQLCRRSRLAPAIRGRTDAHGPERQHTRRPTAPQSATVHCPVPPGSQPRPTRLALPIQRFREDDGGVERVNALGPINRDMKRLSLLVVLLQTCGFALAGTSSDFARTCGVEASVSSARVFADSGDGKWKHYPNPKSVPDGDPDWSE